MMLALYQGQPAAFVGATRHALMPELEALPADHPDRRRVDAVCLFALEVRRVTASELTEVLSH